jgi:hypothetical protein
MFPVVQNERDRLWEERRHLQSYLGAEMQKVIEREK